MEGRGVTASVRNTAGSGRKRGGFRGAHILDTPSPNQRPLPGAGLDREERPASTPRTGDRPVCRASSWGNHSDRKPTLPGRGGTGSGGNRACRRSCCGSRCVDMPKGCRPRHSAHRRRREERRTKRRRTDGSRKRKRRRGRRCPFGERDQSSPPSTNLEEGGMRGR